MPQSYRRYLPAIIYSLVGVPLALVIVYNTLASGRLTEAPDAVARFVDEALNNIPFWVSSIFPIMILTYFITIFPVSLLFVFGNRIVKGPTNTQSIIETGMEFSFYRILGRAVVPALFAVSTGQLIWGFIRTILFQSGLSVYDPIDIFVIVSTISTLVLLPVSLTYFAPTWLLNDAGVVSHLKLNQMKARRCPDTIGVGRWFSNLLGGYSLVVTLAATVYNHLFFSYVNIFRSIALPFFAIAFVLPIVLLHEFLVPRTVPLLHRLVSHLGVKRSHSLEDLMLESMSKLQRRESML